MNKSVNILLLVVGISLAGGFSPAVAASLDDITGAILEQNYTKAETLAKDVLSASPAPAQRQEALFLLGLSYLYQDRFAPARDIFLQMKKSPLDARLADKVAIGLVDTSLLEGQYQTALKEAERLLKNNPRPELLSLVYLKLARAHFKLADWVEAKAYLEKIIKDFPDSPEYFTAKQLLEEKGFFTVQVGSFIEQARAESFVEELKNKGIYAYVVETKDKAERHFYRVRVGELSTIAEAENLKKQLANLGYPTDIYP